MPIEEFVALLAKNNEGEQEALTGYYQLLSAIKACGLPNELYQQISEIISDELNHTEVLNAWMVRLAGIRPNKD